jgi:uncharacterized protein
LQIDQIISDIVAGLPALPTLFMAISVVFLGGVLRGFIGFGGALIIIPVLAGIFTPSEAVAMHLIMEIPGTLQLLPIAWRQCDKHAVTPTLVAIVIGTPLGAYLLATLDPQPMRIGISLMVLAIVALLTCEWRYPGNIGRGIMAAAGIVGGIAQGATGMGSPPMVVVVMSRADNTDTTRGNVLAVATGLIAVAVPMQWAYGLFTAKALLLGLSFGPLYVLSTYLGSRFYTKSGNRIYRSSVLVLLAMVAVYTLVTNV